MTGGSTPWQIDLHRLIGREEIQFDPAALRRAVAGRHVVITGAGGSIGSALAERVDDLGAASLLLIEHHEDSLFDLRRAFQWRASTAAARFALVDVRDREALLREFRRRRPDLIFHLAAYKHVPIGEENPAAVIRVNLSGTLVVLDAAAELEVPALVYPSTDKAVNPPSVYGATKRAVELMLREYWQSGICPSPSVVRLVNTVGAQGGVIRTFAEQAASGLPLTITDPAWTRYWISMSEALGLLLTAADLGTFGPFALAVGDAVTLGDVARRTWAVVRADGSPAQIRVIGARKGERAHERLVRDDERLVPSGYDGVFAVEPVDRCTGGSRTALTGPVIDRVRTFLRDLPLDDGDLRRELFAVIAEPLGTHLPCPVSSAADA